MRPDVLPSMRALEALRLSVEAERDGRLDDALKYAQEAVSYSQMWARQLGVVA